VASKRGAARRRGNPRRKPKEQAGGVLRAYSKCAGCGKWCYPSRAYAEAAVRLLHPGVTMHFYKCALAEEKWWHYTSMTAARERAVREQRARGQAQADG
jgi:hypothetical protein